MFAICVFVLYVNFSISQRILRKTKKVNTDTVRSDTHDRITLSHTKRTQKMPRKLFARMDLDDRDPDGFKFPSKKNNNPRKASEPTTTKPPLRFGENGNGKTKNKMRGGIQFRNKEEEKEEDGERAQFDAWIVDDVFHKRKAR